MLRGLASTFRIDSAIVAGVLGSSGSNMKARSLLFDSSPLMSPLTTAENGLPVLPTYRPASRIPRIVFADPATVSLWRKSRSDAPQELSRSRGSLLIAVKVVIVRARQQP